jgi:hypothetical protein
MVSNPSDEILQNLYERQIGDGFVALGAVSNQQFKSLCFGRGRNLIRKPRLANAGFPRDKKQTAASGSRFAESA